MRRDLEKIKSKLELLTKEEFMEEIITSSMSTENFDTTRLLIDIYLMRFKLKNNN